MNNKILYKVFIITFVILYLCTAGISFFHAIEFFNIGNPSWMSVVLAGVFEIGQATVLASLLLSDNKKAIMPWVLMILLTTVQVIGNVYSTYKFMALSDINYYQYLEKPLLFWANGISQETVMVIISYIIGALLPIVALCMTSMVTTNIKLQNNVNTNKDKLSSLEAIKITNNEVLEVNKTDDNTVKIDIQNEEDIYNDLLNRDVLNDDNELNHEDDKNEEIENKIQHIEAIEKPKRSIASVEF